MIRKFCNLLVCASLRHVYHGIEALQDVSNTFMEHEIRLHLKKSNIKLTRKLITALLL